MFLAFEMSGLLVGESALPEQEPADPGRARAEPAGVDSIIHMRTLHTGPDELLVAVKIGVRRDLPSSELAVVIDDGGGARPRGGADGEVDLPRARHRARPQPDRRARVDPPRGGAPALRRGSGHLAVGGTCWWHRPEVRQWGFRR